MTGPMGNSSDSKLIPPPRHRPPHPEHSTKEWEKRLLEAERHAAEAMDRLLADYLQLIEVAGNAYSRETERAIRAYNRLEEPARREYERRLEIAVSAYDSILGPADAEFTRIAAAAQEMYDKALKPIIAAYAQAVQNAQAVSSGISLGNQPTG